MAQLEWGSVEKGAANPFLTLKANSAPWRSPLSDSWWDNSLIDPLNESFGCDRVEELVALRMEPQRM